MAGLVKVAPAMVASAVMARVAQQSAASSTGLDVVDAVMASAQVTEKPGQLWNPTVLPNWVRNSASTCHVPSASSGHCALLIILASAVAWSAGDASRYQLRNVGL